MSNVCTKYKHLPDTYYGGVTQDMVTPAKLREQLPPLDVKSKSQVKLWEWYSGSSSLSSKARETDTSHLPPIDYRYGWNISKIKHQALLLQAMLVIGVDCLFASPNCAAWGQDSRSVTESKRTERRAKETPTLIFLAFACLIQVLLGRKYIIENSGYSDIFEMSPLRPLRDIPFFMSLFDHCTCGPTLEGQHVRKRSHFQGSHCFHHLQRLCQGGRQHMQLRVV